MIDTFYGFSHTPFAKDIPPDQLLTTPAREELHRRLEYIYHASDEL